MFCDRCGAQINGAANFCPGCGRTFQAVRAAGDGRVARHVRTLGILWLVYSGLRVFQSLAVSTFFSGDWWFFDRMPFFLPGMIRAVGGFFAVAALVGVLAGWGLMERKPWARTLAIVLGVIVLVKFPVGTALGIYTLWTLAPAQSEAEYRSVQVG